MKDFLRFILMVSVVLFGLSILWFGLYLYGSSKTISPYQTELVKSLSEKTPLSIYQAIPLKENQPLKPYMAVEIFFENKDWFLRAQPKNIPFSVFLEQNPQVTLFVQLRLSQSSNASALKSIVDKKDHWKRVAFISDSDGTLKDLRELNPRWTFSSGEVFLARFTSLASLGLHSLLEIPGDIFFVNPETFPANSLSSVVQEAKRQNKFVMLGPVSSAKTLPDVSGWVLVKDD